MIACSFLAWYCQSPAVMNFDKAGETQLPELAEQET